MNFAAGRRVQISRRTVDKSKGIEGQILALGYGQCLQVRLTEPLLQEGC